MRRISESKLSREIKIIKKYVRGGTEEMKDFIENYEDEATIKKIVIHTGANDINKLSNETIIDNTQEIINKCQSKWPNAEITISSVMHRKSDTVKNDIIEVINKATQNLCLQTNVKFMNNDHITKRKDGTIDEEVFYDYIHLNDTKGIRKLAANLKRHLNLSSRQAYRNDGGQRNMVSRKWNSGRRYDGRINENWQQQSWQRNRSRPDYSGYNRKEYQQEPWQQYGQYGGLLDALRPLANWISTALPV